MKARQIPLVLAMLLIFSLASPSAHAVSELPVSNEGELLSAVASAADRDVIRLTDSITCTSAITVLGKSITFNLDGNNLNVITDSDTALYVRNGGVALFGSGELNVSGNYCGVYAEISTVTVTNVTAREFRNLAGAVRCFLGSVTVRGNVTHTGRNGRGIWADSYGKVEVLKDVTVTAKDSLAIEAIGLGASVTVHGNCRAIGTPSFGGISVQNKATVTVNGSLASTGNYVRANGTLLTPAEWNFGNAQYENYRIYFNPGSDQTVVRLQNRVPVAKSPIPTLGITAGTSAVIGGSDLATDADISDTLTITEIVSAPDSAIATVVLSKGSMHISAVASGNTSISVVVTDAFSAATTVTIPINVPALCSIGETGYTELADALTAAKDGDEIRLLDNISFNNLSVSGKEIALNLNGYTLNVGGTNAAEVGSGGRLTILGAGTFTAAGTKYGIYVHGAGVFNYSGTGTFALSGRERCVYADGEGSSVSVPSVTQIESRGVGVYASAGATINVTGDVRASGWFNTCVNAEGGTITVSGNILNTGKEGKAVRAAAGGRVTVNGNISVSNHNYGAYAESGGSITVKGPVLGYFAAYADGTGSSVTALHSVISFNTVGAHAKNGAVISVGIDITNGEARAESGGKIMVGRDIVCSGNYESYGARATGVGSSVEVGRNVSASGGLVSVGANAIDGGMVAIQGSITGATGSMVSIGAEATNGTVTVDGTIRSSGVYIRVNSADKAAGNYMLGSSPYENYMVYQNGAGIVRVKIPTVINSVMAAPLVLPVSGGAVSVTVSGYSIPIGIMVAAFDESGAATGITGFTTGSVNVQTALLTFPANTVITEKTYTIKVSLNGGAAWNAVTAVVAVEPFIKAVPPVVYFPSASSITYGQPLSRSLLTGGSGNGTFAWESPDTIPSINNTGYTVVFTPDDVDNYDYTDVTLSQTVNITVYKATPAVTFPTAAEITYGQSLAACVLTGGSGDGIFAWENPDEIPTVVNSDYNVKFTPNDADNYITMIRTIAVSVRKAAQPTALTFALPESLAYGDTPFQISGSDGNGSGAFSYSVALGDAVSVSKTGMVTVLRPGEAVITAVKAGNADYLSQTKELRLNVNKGVQNRLTISGIPSKIFTGHPPFNLTVSGGSSAGALSYSVSSGNSVSVDESGAVTVLKEGKALLSVTKAEDEYFLATTATVEIYVRKAAPTPSPSPSSSALPTTDPGPTPPVDPGPTSTVDPGPTPIVDPGPTSTVDPGPSATDTPPSQDDSSAPVIIKPRSIKSDEKTGKIVVIIPLDNLPEGTTAIKLLSGEIIQLDAAQDTFKLFVSRMDINEDSELVLIMLNEEQTPLGSYLIDLSADVWQNGTINGKTGFNFMFIWIAAGVLVISGAMTAMFILLSKKK